MAWITPRQALLVIGAQKLADFTNEPGQQEPIGIGDGSEDAFLTPFVFGADLKVYVNGTLQTTGYTVAPSEDEDDNERWVVTFTQPPADEAVVTASSNDAANADNFDAALLEAQRLVRGPVDEASFDFPATDADPEDVPSQILDWVLVVTWYLLATNPRRQGLLSAYPEIEKRYIDVYGGVDSDLKRVAKGTFSLRGILNFRAGLGAAGITSSWISTPKVYTERGVA